MRFSRGPAGPTFEIDDSKIAALAPDVPAELPCVLVSPEKNWMFASRPDCLVVNLRVPVLRRADGSVWAGWPRCDHLFRERGPTVSVNGGE